jgi:hypothetical protein
VKERFIKLIKDLEPILEKYQLRFVGGVYDRELNLRTLVISDDADQRDVSSEDVCQDNYGFDYVAGNRLSEGDLH